LKEILKIGVPSIVSFCSALFIETINSAFVGHLGAEDIMAGVGMANMYMNITCLSVLFGFNMTLNTVVSQAFGFGDYRMCGIYLNRARIIVSIIYVPLSLFLLQTERIFILVGFDRSASHYA
jgi:multidrug resistance protein, MATE family